MQKYELLHLLERLRKPELKTREPFFLPRKLPDFKRIEEIDRFFSNSNNRQRLIFCTSIPVDTVDYDPEAGSYPGFQFIEKVNYYGSRNLRDRAFLAGLTASPDKNREGILLLNNGAMFPGNKYKTELITKENNGLLFETLIDIFQIGYIDDSNQRPRR